MCGIVGYVGMRKARPLLLAGLERLEYRGYDSAGISVLDGDRIDAIRAVGNLSKLRSAIEAADAAGVADAGVDNRATAVALAEHATPSHRHRSYALGDARPRHRAKRASARRHE